MGKGKGRGGAGRGRDTAAAAGRQAGRSDRQGREFDWWYLGKAQVLSGPGRQRGEVHE